MDTYTIDPDRTSLTFTVPGLIRTYGEFTRSVGTVTVDEHGNPQALDVTIAAASLHTGISLRDAHLKTAMYLGAERYPVITYTSQHIEQIEANRYAVRGMLRLHGQMQPVALDVTLDAGIQPDGARRVHVKGAVAHTEFGVPSAPMRWVLTPIISDKVIVTADVHLTPVSASTGTTPSSVTQSHS